MEIEVMNNIAESTGSIDDAFVAVREEVGRREIKTQGDLSEAGTLLKQIKDYIKQVEEKRTEFVKPLNDTVKRINDVFKTKVNMAEEIRRMLEKKMIVCQEELNRIRRIEEEKRREEEKKKLAEQQKKLEEAATKINSEKLLNEAIKVEQRIEKMDDQPFEQKKTITGNGTQTTFKTVIDYEVIDPALVPRQFCVPDNVLIRNAIKNGTKEIAGVRIFEKQVIANR